MLSLERQKAVCVRGNSCLVLRDAFVYYWVLVLSNRNNWIRLILKNSREEVITRSAYRYPFSKNGLGDQLQNILVNVIAPTRKEQGNIAYVLHRSMDNPDELMFDELWVDQQSLEAHLKQPYII